MGTLLLMIDLRYVVLTGVLWVSDTEHVGYIMVCLTSVQSAASCVHLLTPSLQSLNSATAGLGLWLKGVTFARTSSSLYSGHTALKLVRVGT